jgi:hypothetical protein
MNGMYRSQVFPRVMRFISVTRILVFMTIFWTVNSIAESKNSLTLYPAEVEAIFSFDHDDRNGSGNSSFSSQETDSEFGVRLVQEAYLYDPDIAWFIVDIEPSIMREDTKSSTLTEDSSGRNLDYFFQADILQETTLPVGFNIQIQHSSDLLDGSLGSQYDNVIDTKQASVDWKLDAFPISLTYRDEVLDQEFQTSLNDQLSKRNENLQNWVLKGGSSKLDLRLEHENLDDLISTRNNDFEQDEAYLRHWLSWGRASELRSILEYSDRNGFNANKRLTFEENARIQHTENTFSRTFYRYFSITQNTETEEHNSKFELNHNLYGNLTTIASVEADAARSDNLDENIQTVELFSRYQKQDLFGATVNAGLGVSYGETDRDSTFGLVDVVDESHTARLNGVILNTRFIFTSTIIITDSTGTIVYSEGFDYVVNNRSGDLTEVQIIAGGQINDGDSILVSYQAQALPSQKFSTTYSRYNLGINLGWLRLSHSDSKSNDSLISGADESFLNDTRFTITDIEFRWELNKSDLLLGAQRNYQLAGGFSSTTYTYKQTFSWTYSRDFRLNLSTIESFTEEEDQDTDLYSLDLSIDWRPLPALSIVPTVGFWQRQDTENSVPRSSSEDEFITAGFKLHWKYRQIAVDFSYFRDRRTLQTNQTVDGNQVDEYKYMFRLIRKFL